jgi:hypothetical protein
MMLCDVEFPGVQRYVYGGVPPLAVAVSVTDGTLHVRAREPAIATDGTWVAPHVTLTASTNVLGELHTATPHASSWLSAHSVTSYVPATDGAVTVNVAENVASHAVDSARQPQLQ